MGKRIYMVEDEMSLNILLSKYLEKEGYTVTAFDLILIDIKNGGFYGFNS